MELMERAIKLGLPATALDDLIDQLGGPDHVAEMTARLPLLGTLVLFLLHAGVNCFLQKNHQQTPLKQEYTNEKASRQNKRAPHLALD